MTIFYEFDGKLYANITNKCPCACTFCIRKNSDGVAGSGSLWLEHEPDFNEIKEAFDGFDKTGLSELVFCGYGEPMMRAELLLKTAEYVKEKTNMIIRVNTNGLIPFMNPDFDISLLKYKIDKVSIILYIMPYSQRNTNILRSFLTATNFFLAKSAVHDGEGYVGNIHLYP